MTFTNDPIDLEGAPRLPEDEFVPLDPAHQRLITLGHVIGGAIVAVAGGAAATGLGVAAGLIGLAGLVLVGLSWLRASIEVRHIGWLVREHDLSYRHGVITRSVATLPFSRIQHARIERGPLQRMLGIATLHVNSAGPDLRISGLAEADAETLKAVVVERSGATDTDDT